MRICVIGAGIVGSNIAYQLSKNTAIELTVIDGNYPGRGATAAGWSWINANAKEPTSYFELNVEGMQEYERLARDLSSDSWLNRAGCLVTTAGNEEAALRVDRARQLGYAAELVSSEDVTASIEPALKLQSGRKVAFFPRESWLDAVLLAETLIAVASERGALCHFGRSVTELELLPDKSFRVGLSDSTSVACDVVINAAGAGADKVAALLGRRLELRPTIGVSMRVRAEQSALRRIVLSPSIDVRPDGPSHFRFHANAIDERVAQGGQDRNLMAAEFLRRAALVFHGFDEASVVDTRIAPRPMPEDGLTWAGQIKDINGYYECVTHSGATLGALMGRLVAEEIMTGRDSDVLALFRPDR